MTLIFAVDPDTGRLTHIDASTLRSIAEGAGVVRCPTCGDAGPLLRREGEGSLLPVAHARTCGVLDLDRFLLHVAVEEYRARLADAGEAPDDGAVFTSATLHAIYPEEVAVLGAFGHAADRTAQVRTVVDASGRRRVYLLTDGTSVIW